MFARKARNPLTGPETLNSGIIKDKLEDKISRDIQPVLTDRTTAIMQAVAGLEATKYMHAGSSEQAPTLGNRMMKGVPINRVEPVKEEPTIALAETIAPVVQLHKTTAMQPVEGSTKNTSEAKIYQLDEARSRELLQQDAHRQIVQAFEPQTAIEAAVITENPVQPIPDIVVVSTDEVIAARAGVEAALQARAEAERASSRQQREMEELQAFMAQHREQRQVAA